MAGVVWVRWRLGTLARAERAGLAIVQPEEVFVPDDLLPLHDGVSPLATRVLVREASADSGPFRDGATRIAHAWVD